MHRQHILIISDDFMLFELKSMFLCSFSNSFISFLNMLRYNTSIPHLYLPGSPIQDMYNLMKRLKYTLSLRKPPIISRRIFQNSNAELYIVNCIYYCFKITNCRVERNTIILGSCQRLQIQRLPRYSGLKCTVNLGKWEVPIAYFVWVLLYYMYHMV